MAAITLTRDIGIAGAPHVIGEALTVSFSLARQLVGDGCARWTNGGVTRSLPLNVNGTDFIPLLSDVTALTGDAPAGLGGYLLAGIPAGLMFEVKLATENIARRYLVITKSGETADADSTIEPPDFDATGNNKLLLRVQ